MVWIMAEKRWSMGCKCRGRLVIATDATGPQSRLASGSQMHAAPQRRARQRHVMGIGDVEGIDAVFAARERRMPKQALRLLAAFGGIFADVNDWRFGVEVLVSYLCGGERRRHDVP